MKEFGLVALGFVLGVALLIVLNGTQVIRAQVELSKLSGKVEMMTQVCPKVVELSGLVKKEPQK